MGEKILMEHVIDPVLRLLTDHITKHLGYTIFSTKKVKEMRERMKHLEDISKDVKTHMDTNLTNKKEIPSGVSDWLTEVENVRKEVEGIPSDDIGCSKMKTRYRVGRNAFEATETIEKLIKENMEFNWTDAPIPTGKVNPKPASSTTSTLSFSSVGGDVFKSREKPFNDALKFLQQDHNKSQVIVLCGMGGVGKTTMMEQLKKVANDNGMFDFIVKVTITRTPNMLSIQNDIAVQLGGEGLREANVPERADTLCEKFKQKLEVQKKTILIILDDVWEGIELKNIGLTSPLPNGVKLFLTSRYSNNHIAGALSSIQVVRVDALEEAEAHNFFSRFTGVSKEDDHDLYKIGCEIVKKCGCLPLAIELIGRALNSQQEHVWKTTLKRLKNNDLDKNVQEIVKISYERIEEDEECKEIFLHCGLFPEDANIPIEDLTRHAWGLKLLKYVSTLSDARDTTNTCVSKLINANLLMNGDHLGCVKMHDLVLVFVLGEISKGDRSWIINHGDVSMWGRDKIGKSCKRLSVTCKGMSEFPTKFEYPELSFLQLMDGNWSLNFPEDFYENMKKLEVITYYNMQYPLLPRSLHCSANLKALCLHHCKLMVDCSFIGDLVNLEVLSFADCQISELPSTFGNLSRLKLLDLTGCSVFHIADGVFEKLKNLEELYMTVSSKTAIRFTQANLKELKMLSSKLRALEVEFFYEMAHLKNMYFNKLLEKFKISIGCLLEDEKRYKQYKLKNALRLVIEKRSELKDCRINELFLKTEKLYLQVNDMIGLEDIVSMHPSDLHSICNLRDLEVSKCANLKYLFPISVARGLRKLERLKIWSCSVLEALVEYDGSEINLEEIVSMDPSDQCSFCKLRDLEVSDCAELKYLFPVSVARGLRKLERLQIWSCSVLEALVEYDGSEINSVFELPQLVELDIGGLPNVTSIYPDKNNISAFLNSQLITPELKKLGIRSMDNLKQIWSCEIGSSSEEVNNISTLREIKVRRCESLVNLFPTNPMRLLNHLETLYVDGCGSIEEIFNIDLDCVDQDVEQLNSSSNMRLKSIWVYDSDNVRGVWRIKGGENNSSLIIHGFEAVESIKIKECKMFRNVFTPTNNTKFDMRALPDIITVNYREEPWEQKERDDDISVVAFSSNLMQCHNLHKLTLWNGNGVEVVFEIASSPSSRELVTTTTNNQLLPNLQSLRLREMEGMSHVWKCTNWNNFLILQTQSSFHNLTTIKMWRCNRIKYLFSPLMAKLLSNLKTIEIESCDGMEEVVSNRDDKKEDEVMTTFTSTTTFFPHLHLLDFQNLKNLKRVGGGGDQFKVYQTHIVSWSLCQYSREILIYSCDELSNVIPYYALGQLQKLQVLEVRSCAYLTEVFETERINNNKSCGDSSSTNIDSRNEGTDTICTTVAIPKLKIINVPQLSNLKKLQIISCDLLQYVFTFPTLESLKKLEVLTIRNCQAMKMIVKEEIGDQTSTLRVVEFTCLKSLELSNLPNLECFFFGRNEFRWPLVDKVMISTCPQMMVFTRGQSTAPLLKYIHTSQGKHSLECGLNFHVTTDMPQTTLPSSESTSLCSTTLEQLPWSFHNLVEIDIESEKIKCIIPSNELQQLKKLERIHVDSCGEVKEVFEVESIEGTNGDSQTVVQIPNLTQLELEFLYNLKYIWNSNHHQRTTLEFPNLTTLFIIRCDSLEHVFTSSMIGSLQKLQHLHISGCPKMEVIVKEEEECDAKVVLPSLQSMELEYLESLKGFCLGKNDFSWPLLDTMEITGCPEITVFTKGQLETPALKVIDTSFGRCYVKEDLNSFIQTKQQEGFFYSRR